MTPCYAFLLKRNKGLELTHIIIMLSYLTINIYSKMGGENNCIDLTLWSEEWY